MEILLILIIIFFILPPLFTRLLRWYLRRKAQQFFQNMTGGKGPFGQASTQNNQYKETTPRPKPRKKKIDKNVGEYVDFEEISVYKSTIQTTVGTDSAGNTNIETTQTEQHITYTEDQITDAEWEDIK